LVPDDKLVVLGLVTTKTPRAETVEDERRKLAVLVRTAQRVFGAE
jgi:hypothetical protein